MPMYDYECIYCSHIFEEINNVEKSGKTKCPKCANTAFKIPSVFNVNIFKPRKFGDGTTTPPHVNTPRQEKDWMRSENITYDPPQSVNLKYINKKAKEQKSKTAMKEAFESAVKKVNDGFRLETNKNDRKKKRKMVRLV